MRNTQYHQSFVLAGGAGCLWFLLGIFNFLFGWLFLDFKTWLAAEAVLAVLFLVSSLITVKKISSAGSRKQDKRIIDVEAEVVDDKKKIS